MITTETAIEEDKKQDKHDSSTLQLWKTRNLHLKAGEVITEGTMMYITMKIYPGQGLDKAGTVRVIQYNVLTLMMVFRHSTTLVIWVMDGTMDRIMVTRPR